MTKKYTKTEIDSTRVVVLFLLSVLYCLAFYFLDKYYYYKVLVISDYIIYFYIGLTIISALILALGIFLWYKRYRKSINESQFLFSGGFFIYFGCFAFLLSLSLTFIEYKNLFTSYTYIILAVAFVSYVLYKIISFNFGVYSLICGYTIVSLVSLMDFYSDTVKIQVINLLPRSLYYIINIIISLLVFAVIFSYSIRQKNINKKYGSKSIAISYWPAAIMIGVHIASIVISLFYYNYVFISALIINIVVLIMLAILRKCSVIKI